MEQIILFDGDCNLCHSSVQFIIKRDPKARFKFASLQSDYGEQLIDKFELPSGLDSFVVIKGDQVFIQSDAALAVAKHLSGGWKWLRLFTIVPRPIRDFVYRLIAANRYRLFGRRTSCLIPTPELQKRFFY